MFRELTFIRWRIRRSSSAINSRHAKGIAVDDNKPITNLNQVYLFCFDCIIICCFFFDLAMLRACSGFIALPKSISHMVYRTCHYPIKIFPSVALLELVFPSLSGCVKALSNWNLSFSSSQTFTGIICEQTSFSFSRLSAVVGANTRLAKKLF